MKLVRMVLLPALVVTFLAPSPLPAAAQEAPEVRSSFYSGIKIRGVFQSLPTPPSRRPLT